MQGESMPRSKESEELDSLKFEPSSGNIFVDLGFSQPEAANLYVRGQLALEIRKLIQANGWSQREAARKMEIAQPRVAEVMKMRIENFSIDTLVNYLSKLGCKVSMVVEPNSDEVA
jgi:predicted XRE-type DNA-binding protein